MDLSDAKALLERAKRHYTEFEHLTDVKLWRVSERTDSDTGEWVYSISLDRKRLIAAGPVVADCAHNISSALDHIAAAIARHRGRPRRDNLYFPCSLDDDRFERRASEAEKELGPEMLDVIRAARKKHWHEANHLESAKKISREGKHWELKAANGKAHSIKWLTEGDYQGQLFQVPANAFESSDTFEFHRSAERLPKLRGYEIFVGIEIEGLGDLVKSPSSIFPCAIRYVQGTIDAVEEAAAPTA